MLETVLYLISAATLLIVIGRQLGRVITLFHSKNFTLGGFLEVVILVGLIMANITFVRPLGYRIAAWKYFALDQSQTVWLMFVITMILLVVLVVIPAIPRKRKSDLVH
jgi:hypothetical protein